MTTENDAEWVRRVMAAVKPLLPPEFDGRIEINVSRGGISNVNVRRTYTLRGGDIGRPG